ncbi:hypothetical protein CRUP_008718 [Coryphaenoides rupestris]|nr:hypothetical protein CRUP_008718 [Coryphaenoides rupestris]
MKEMIGGCCVCSDERGWAENPLVYCDGHGCSVAVHQACYGIVQVPTGPWFCRKCESQERAARVRCELCPHKDGALKRTDNGGWAHVVCALYIPEVEFANVSTMEPIVLQSVPHERYNKTCYICDDQGRESKAATGACMTCNKHGCRQAFHVTCAQFAGLLCEEQGSDADNVKYCGYCKYHHSKLKHKERDRHKPKHKKTPLDMSPSLVLPNAMVPDKGYNCSSGSGGGVASLPPAGSQKRLDDGTARFTTANFQEVPSAHAAPGGGGVKDGSADGGKPGPETKNKKGNIGGAGAVAGGGHVVGQRGGRKSLASSGKPLPSAPVTMKSPSLLRNGTLPGHAGSTPTGAGLLLTSASKTSSSAPSSSDFLGFSDSSLRPGGGTTFSSPPSFSSCLVKTASEAGASDGSTTLFGSLVSATAVSGVGGKLYENSHSLTPPDTVNLGRAQPSTSGAGPGLVGAGALGGDDGVKKKKKGNWRNRFGPCFTTDTKPPLPPADGSSSVTGLGAMGGTNSELSQQQTAAPSLAPPSPFMATTPLTTTASTHVSSLPGSVFNLAPSHMFGNRLNPNSAMAALIAQSEATPADQEVGDGSSTGTVGAQGFSIRASPKTTPRSPIGGLQIRYDPSGSVSGPGLGMLGAGGAGGGVGGDTLLPPVATNVKGSQLGAADSSLPVAAQSPPQPQLNGMATTPATGSLMGSLGAASTLNGVIQTPAGPPHGHASGPGAAVNMPEQQQVLLYQLMQQQQDLQHLQAQMPLSSSASSSSSSSSTTSSSAAAQLLLQPGTAAQGGGVVPAGAIASNPFLALQHAHADGGPKPRLTADKTEKT